MREKLGEGFAYHVTGVSVYQHRSHQKCKAITSKRVTRYTFTLTHLDGRGLHAPPSNFAEKAIRARRVRSCRCLAAVSSCLAATNSTNGKVDAFRVDAFSSKGSTYTPLQGVRSRPGSYITPVESSSWDLIFRDQITLLGS